MIADGVKLEFHRSQISRILVMQIMQPTQAMLMDRQGQRPLRRLLPEMGVNKVLL
jgi:hypothetical protein